MKQFYQHFPVIFIQDEDGTSRVPTTVSIPWFVGTQVKAVISVNFDDNERLAQIQNLFIQL